MPQAGDTHSGGPRAATGRRGSLLGLSWAHLLNDGASNYLPGVLPAVLATLGEPTRMAGVLVTALTIGQILQPVAGRIADRLGGRSLVIGGLTLASVAGGLIGVTGSTWLLIVLLVLVGIGNAFFHPQALAGVRSMLANRQGLPTSFFLVAGELGRGLWPTAASLIVSHLGLPWLWLVALPGVITAPFLLRFMPKLAPKRSQGAPIRFAEHARPVSLLIAYQGIRTLSIYSFVTFIPVLWHARGHSLVMGASMVTVMTTVGVVGNLWGGHLTDRIGTRPVLLVSAAASALLVVPTAYASGPAAWILAGLLGIALFMTAPTTVLIGQDIFPENRSMGSGIALGFANGVGALLVFVIGLFITDATIMVVFWVLALLGLVSLLPALMFRRTLLQPDDSR